MHAPEVFSMTMLTATLIGCLLGTLVMVGIALAALLWVIDYILNSWRM